MLFPRKLKRLSRQEVMVEQEEWCDGNTGSAYDDVAGEKLDPSMVRRAREEEIKYYSRYPSSNVGELLGVRH